jgi:hypothetical protein
MEFPQRRRTLRSRLAHQRKSLGWKNYQRLILAEREGFAKKATVRGFKYPQTRAWPNIVWADRTLSGPARLCLAQPDLVWLGLSVRNRRADLENSEI